VGSVILSRFVLSTVEMRDKRVTTASESEFDRQFREKVSDKKVKLSDEYEVPLPKYFVLALNLNTSSTENER